MKKSHIALILSSILFLSACDTVKNKKLEQQLQQAENQIQTLQQKLSSSQDKIQELQKMSEDFPSLNVKIEELFNKSEDVPNPKAEQKDTATDDKKETEEAPVINKTIPVSIVITTAKTGVNWLDNLLIDSVYQLLKDNNDPEMVQDDSFKDNIVDFLNKRFNSIVTNIQHNSAEYNPLGTYFILKTEYLGQRNNIVSFRQLTDSYDGGAHPMSDTLILNINTKTHTIINAEDLVTSRNLPSLAEILWQDYLSTLEPGSETFSTKEDFYVSDNFYITAQGIEFVYPQYVLGPYSDGATTLKAPIDKINKLLVDEYKFNAKNGYNQTTEN